MKSFNKSVFLSLTVGVFILVGMFLFAGCTGMSVEGKSLMVSASGVKAESFISDNAWMVFKMGSSDSDQIIKLNKLMDLFPANLFDLLMEEMATGFNENMSQYGFDFEEDVLPAIGDNWQLMVSFAGEISDDKEPIVMVVFMPKDAKKIVELIKKMPENGKGSEIKLGEYTVYSNEQENAFFVRYEDLILVSNNMDALKEGIEGTVKSNLLTNQVYQKGTVKAVEGIGFVFIDPVFLAVQMQADASSEEELKEVEQFTKTLSTVKGEFFSLVVEDDGIRIEGFVLMDMVKWKDLGLADFYGVHGDSYLYKQLPGKGMFLYAESADIKGTVSMSMDMYKDIKDMGYVISMLKASLAMVKLDLEDDILSFMDKGYAFSMYSNGGLVPGFGMYVDAKSNLGSAKKIMSRINQGIDNVLVESEMNEEKRAIINHDKADCDEGECYVLDLDFDKLPKEDKQAIGEEFANQKISLQYGVNEDDLAFFSLYPDFLKGGYETMDQNLEFMKALEDIPGSVQQVSYLNVQALTDLVDRWVQYGLKVEGNENGEGMEDYYMVMDFLKPVKYVVSGGKAQQGGEIEMELFIKLSN